MVNCTLHPYYTITSSDCCGIATLYNSASRTRRSMSYPPLRLHTDLRGTAICSACNIYWLLTTLVFRHCYWTQLMWGYWIGHKTLSERVQVEVGSFGIDEKSSRRFTPRRRAGPLLRGKKHWCPAGQQLVGFEVRGCPRPELSYKRYYRLSSR